MGQIEYIRFCTCGSTAVRTAHFRLSITAIAVDNSPIIQQPDRSWETRQVPPIHKASKSAPRTGTHRSGLPVGNAPAKSTCTRAEAAKSCRSVYSTDREGHCLWGGGYEDARQASHCPVFAPAVPLLDSDLLPCLTAPPQPSPTRKATSSADAQ
jgi:hypothetical protein